MTTVELNTPETYAFTAAELGRLVIYRAAVQAGFFTDQCLEGEERVTQHALCASGRLDNRP